MRKIQFLNQTMLTKPVPGETLEGWYLWQRWDLKRREQQVAPATEFKDRWSSDYMGSSEFEWGSVPRAIRNFCEEDNLVVIKFTGVDDNGREVKFKQFGWKFNSIQVVCRIDQAGKIANMVHMVATRKFDDATFKESTYLDSNSYGSIHSTSKFKQETNAWLSIDRGHEFFMWLDNPDLIPDVKNILLSWKNKPLPK